MIKFFRKIRQTFLIEKKIGQYLKYAVGEIILVVIGILIALQINNWNEGRINSSLVNTYKKSLIQNLVKDSVNIQNKLIEINEDLKIIEEYEHRVSISNNPFDTIREIARNEYNFRIQALINFENETYQVLNSTGHLALFSQNIVGDLNSLYSLQESALEASNLTLVNYARGISNYTKSYPATFNNNLIKNGTVSADTFWNSVSPSRHATEFNSLIIIKSDNYRLSLLRLPEIQDRIGELLRKLRE